MELVNIDIGFDPTNFFVYKNKKYPLNLDVFKCSSKKFQNVIYRKNQDIALLNDDEEIDFPEDSIILFILYSHNDQRKEIDGENIVFVNYLAKKYGNNNLIIKTEYLISQNPEKFRIQQLMFNNNNDNEKIQFIKEISSQFNDIVKSNQRMKLLKLSLPIIWQIINEYKKSSDFSDEIIEFLLDYLNEQGRKASVLFSLIDFDKMKMEYMNALLTKYSDIFDFNFINKHCCKTIYESQEKIIKDQSILNDKLTQELEKQKQVNSQLQIQINELKQIVNNLHLKIHYPYSEPSKGILSYLTTPFELTAGGKKPHKGPVSNILKYDDTKFYNYNNNSERTIENKDECWILFDFKSVKVIIESYLIRSNYSPPNKFHHPKSWILQGSDDMTNWDTLDERENDNSLNGEYKENRFICKNYNNNKSYRYIKYIQNECWSDKSVAGPCYNLYNIYITYFQLFGDVVIPLVV